MRHVQLDAQAITNLAAAKGIDSVSELARRCQRSQSGMRRILIGERPAQPKLVLTLARVLEVAPSALLDPSEAELGRVMDAALVDEQAAAS